jgi:soluble lytic murein transglycosylase-like protein
MERKMSRKPGVESAKGVAVALGKVFLAILALFPSAVSAFCFDEAAREYGIPRPLIESIAETESAMNPRALNLNPNRSLDFGLMQVNSFWVQAMGLKKEKLMGDPCYNVMTGSKILKQCIDRYGYNWEAVGCYNATSSRKRINYSWKVYHALLNRPKEPGQQPDQRPTSSSSLVFEVRDVTEGQAVKP